MISFRRHCQEQSPGGGLGAKQLKTYMLMGNFRADMSPLPYAPATYSIQIYKYATWTADNVFEGNVFETS